MLRVERDVVSAVIHQGAALTIYATWYNGSVLVTLEVSVPILIDADA